jgi:hypothetical protein
MVGYSLSGDLTTFSVSANVLIPGVYASVLSAGPDLRNNPSVVGWVTDNWYTSPYIIQSVVEAVTGKKYFQFAIAPTDSGIIINGLSGLAISRSTTGPNIAALVYNTNNNSSWTYGTYTLLATAGYISTSTSLPTKVSPIINTNFFATSTITITYPNTGYFRLYGLSAYSSAGTWRLHETNSTLDDFWLSGIAY